MSLLNGATKTVAQGPNPWAGRVKALGACPPWWNTASVLGVVEVSVQNVIVLILHVGRSKQGRLFAAAPASKNGETWVKHFDIADAQLREAIEAAAINAYQAMAGQTMVDDDRPF